MSCHFQLVVVIALASMCDLMHLAMCHSAIRILPISDRRRFEDWADCVIAEIPFDPSSQSTHGAVAPAKCSIATWNLNAMTAHFDELVALNHDIIAVQEVRANARQRARSWL